MIAGFVLCAIAAAQDAPRPGVAQWKEAERVFALGNPEQARFEVERAIAAMLAARPDLVDADDDRAMRDAGALAYKLRSMEPARRAWDAVRRYRERTLDPTSLELQNARGNVAWIGEQMGLVAEARVLEEQILAAFEKTAAPDDDGLQTARGNLADTLLQLGEHERALELFTQVAGVRRAKLPVGHPQRLRSEIDLASAHAGVGANDEAARVLEQALVEAPSKLNAIRVRAAAALALARAASGAIEPTMERLASYGAAVAKLESELTAAFATFAGGTGREAEIRRAEYAPFVDLLVSAQLGLGVRGLEQSRVGMPRASIDAPTKEPIAVYRRWERSRIAGTGRDARIVADERLAAQILMPASSSWIDLGSADDARALVRAWDAAAGADDESAKRAAVVRALFLPVARASGDPARLRIVPDDVIWAVPLHALDLRSDAGRAIEVEVALRASLDADGREESPTWLVFGDPPATSDAAQEWSNAMASTGAAAAYASGVRPIPSDSTAEWARRLGRPRQAADKTHQANFTARCGGREHLVLTVPAWSAPDDVVCATSPRPLVAATPLAAAMAREDVFGGSSPADLCGFLFADYARPAGEDGRVRSAARAADLSAHRVQGDRRLVVASTPARADVVLRARDIEALVRALVDAGATDVCIATRAVHDVEAVTFPADFEAAMPRATRKSASAVPGPWLRARAFR